MSSAPEQNYQRRLFLKFESCNNLLTNHPTDSEDVLYAIFNEFVALHQQHRFAIYLR